MHKKTGRKKEKIFSVLFDALFYAKMGVLRHTSTYPGPNSAPDYHKTKILLLNHQPQPFHLAPVLRAALHDINPCRLHAGVAQEVRQLCNILFQSVEGLGEEVPEVVGEDPLGLHPRRFTEMV